jgi:ABC-type multidrug transport system fused ATPase/permease subunit
LLRKYLNYEENVRAEIKESDVLIGITMDSPHLVDEGYLTIFAAIKELTLLFMYFGYQVIVVALSKKKRTFIDVCVTFFPVVTVPVVMVIFLYLRQHRMTDVLIQEAAAKHDLARCADMTVKNFRVIIAYSRRNYIIDQCWHYIEALNDAKLALDCADVVNNHFPRLLTSVVVLVYMTMGGRQVFDDTLTIGQFLTNLEVCTETCAGWRLFYYELMTMHNIFPSLMTIVRYLNLPIDIRRRRDLSNACREVNEQERQAVRQARKQGFVPDDDPRLRGVLYALDIIPIQFQDVSYRYSSSQLGNAIGFLRSHSKLDDKVKSGGSRSRFKTTCSIDGEDRTVDGIEFGNWNLKIAQGTMVAFIGRHGEGKGTLLKVVGGVLLPAGGLVFLPPQLRNCYITQSPMLFYASLLENLTFGLTAAEKAKDDMIVRIRSICARLGVHPEVIKTLNGGYEGVARDWCHVLSPSQRARLHLARAFISNPEVLVMELPTALFDQRTAHDVLGAIREHVDMKGLYTDSNHRVTARPRTCVLTTMRAEACDLADKVYLVTRHDVEEVRHRNVSEVLREAVLADSQGIGDESV